MFSDWSCLCREVLGPYWDQVNCTGNITAACQTFGVDKDIVRRQDINHEVNDCVKFGD